MDPLKVLFAGVGNRARHHIQAVNSHPSFEACSYVDISEERIKAALDLLPLPRANCYSNLEEALGKVDCDVVFVCSPPGLHAAQCAGAIKEGRHVIVEKPFTKSLAEARNIVKQAESRGLRVLVAQNQRYTPVIQKTCDLIRSGEYGSVCSGIFLKSSYRENPFHSAGDDHAYLWERSVHDIDTLLYMLDPAKVLRVCARSFNPSYSPYKGGASVAGWLEFEGGAVFSLYTTFMAHARMSKYLVECEKAAVLIDDGISILRAGGAEEMKIPFEADMYPKPELRILDDFIAFIAGRGEPGISGGNNTRTLAVVEALGRSSEGNRVIEL